MAGDVGVCGLQVVDEIKRWLLACFGQVEINRFFHIDNGPAPGNNCLWGGHDQRGRAVVERLATGLRPLLPLFPLAPTRERKLLK